MKLSKKDINDFLKETQGGEIAPIICKDGKLFVPTSRGRIIYGKEDNQRKSREQSATV